jgi:hypothetical protein
MESHDVVFKKYRRDDKKLNSYKIIIYLFEQRDYNEFSENIKYGNNETYGAYKFVKLLNLKTCPYYNRNYISMLKKRVGRINKLILNLIISMQN